jgi:hypothetical protein
MPKKLALTFFLLSLFFCFSPKVVFGAEPFPQLKLPCKDQKNVEFNSLRPYQAAPCGEANKALFCSNDLIFVESFEMADHGNCVRQGVTGTFTCKPNFQVAPHDLFVTLDNSNFPIMGNTEKVTNSQNSGDTIDDATKVNEYVSWYLSGVNTRAEYGAPTDDQIVNYSGPLQKLLPSAIAEAQRVKVINDASKSASYTDVATGTLIKDNQNHNQIVVCAKEGGGGFFGWIQDVLNLGKSNPVDCYKGNGAAPQDKVYRLSDWNGNLSWWNTGENAIVNGLTSLFPATPANIIRDSVGNHWNKRTPPLPWSNEEGKPFASDILYQKAYNEWRGNTCIILPIVNQLVCIDNIFVPNRYADLFTYVPLAETTDKQGAENIDGIQFTPSPGATISDNKYGGTITPPLYFAHTQEVKTLSENLNKTYVPKGVQNVPVSKSTETNDCSVVKVRTNSGDNLFPGDPSELQVKGVEYKITEATCHEKVQKYCPDGNCSDTLECKTEVAVTINTSTLTPYADEIFSTTVADSQSTFRKIYPKVQNGAPVDCIADIPTVTDVTYDASKSEGPNGGTQTFGVGNKPDDGSNTNPQLTFPHIGSVYEYFLKGIQTALRPQGYADPTPVSGQNCTNTVCGELPSNLPKATGSCILGGTGPHVGKIPQSLRKLVEAAAQTYKVPPNLIFGIMYGEGLFNPGRFNWTDTNVKNWATCQKIPGCHETGDDNFMGFNGNDFPSIVPHIKADILKLDPTRKKLSQCNLLDAIYAEAWNLHDSADGGMNFSCFGINLNASIPNSCTWNNNQYESAIKVSENGYNQGCFTLPGSCVGGGGNAALCTTGVDGCETLQNRGNNTSHNACIWDVAHGK